jgi:TRAP-type mannitol/chloroaromatic compound transport system permease large subunit
MNKTFNFNYKNRNKSIKEQLRNIKITSYIMLPIILIFEIIGAILIGFTATNTGGLILIVIGLIILFVHDIELAYKIITTD